MVTVAIVAIIAAVALPTYQDYIKRGHIPQATGNLAQQPVKLEQFFQDNRTYTGACADGAVAAPPTDNDFTYSCSIPDGGVTYTITATGKGSMTGFTYTLNQNNDKNTTALPTSWQSGVTLPKSC